MQKKDRLLAPARARVGVGRKFFWPSMISH
jgi:hypothetical protein